MKKTSSLKMRRRMIQLGMLLGGLLVPVLAVWIARPAATTAVAAAGQPEAAGGTRSLASTLAVTATEYVYLPLSTRNFFAPNVFGMEMLNIVPGGYLDLVKSADPYWMRINGLLWSLVEPTQGGGLQWGNVAGLETELANANAADLKTILVIRSTPSWAQLVPDVECGPMKSQYFDEFGSFVAQAVARYSKPPFNVHYYEIWNEPDVDPDIGIPPDDPYGCWGDNSDPYYGGEYYGQMLKVVYPMVKAVAPGVKVITGGFLMDCDPRIKPVMCKSSKFLEGVLKAGAMNSFDIVGFHGYDHYNAGFDTFGNPGWASGKYDNEPDGVLRPVFINKLGYIKEVLGAYGVPNKPIFNTEGALICGGGSDPPGGPGCEATDTSPYELLKAAYVAQSYAAALGENLGADIWFSVRGWRNSGLAYTNTSPRPAYFAYEFSRQMLFNASTVGKVTGYTDVFGYEFNRSEGNSLWVIWATDGGMESITLPFTPAAIWDTFGDPVAVTGTSVTLSVAPYYIEKP